jgi:hypothetical protein
MKIKKDIAVSDSGFVFNPATGDSFSVNPIGMEIIKLMKEGKNLKEISSYIFDNYNVEEKTIEKDLQDFNEMLQHYSIKEENGIA